MTAKEIYRFFVTLTPGQFLLKSLIVLVKRFAYVKIMRIMTLELGHANPLFLGEAPGFTSGYLDREDCRKLAADPIYQMPDSFVDQAFAAGDTCYGFLRNGVLAGYGWHSNTPPPHDDRLMLHYSGVYLYGYKAFTLPEFRGQQLFAYGTMAVLKDHVERGYTGIIGMVEAQNYNSLRSLDRMGFKTFGTIFVVRLFGRYFIRATKGCAKHSCTITVI
jgi:hypothetical protein